ncbi:DUF4236 domain-containing protein [Litoribacter alkaliphilus]|uniref:DUF4236 domain-containing protein n=1 Tax=Litoribacter ruber TaxID=702568 RepID=A0AAP2G208_9BACT|nr:DUF4236 domain-containing protein [Litoribacter alkaliphilus]MBS9525037.1 DUF4236 domain-containing protein [Litoribacter alkaliphilus]
MKFRKRTKLFPGVTLNFSKTGISTTIGIPGASVNIGRNGSFLNTGIPGTGIYDRKRIGRSRKPSSTQILTSEHIALEEIDDLLYDACPSEYTSSELGELAHNLSACYEERGRLQTELHKAKKNLKHKKISRTIGRLLLVGFLISKFDEEVKQAQETVREIEEDLDVCHIDLSLDMDKSMEYDYKKLMEAYFGLLNAENIWDISSCTPNKFDDKRQANEISQNRERILLNYAKLDFIHATANAMHFHNKKGEDLYIYPGFALVKGLNDRLGILRFQDLELEYKQQIWTEFDLPPVDATIVGKTWEKVNKNGKRDLRFKVNNMVPVLEYARINLKSESGLLQSYLVSNSPAAKQFVERFQIFKENLV